MAATRTLDQHDARRPVVRRVWIFRSTRSFGGGAAKLYRLLADRLRIVSMAWRMARHGALHSHLAPPLAACCLTRTPAARTASPLKRYHPGA